MLELTILSIFEKSYEVLKMSRIYINPRNDLFSEPPVNLSNVGYKISTLYPVNAITDDAPIQFVETGSSDYINLAESYFRFKIKIVQADGTDLGEDDNGRQAFVNLPFSSVFKDVKVFMKSKKSCCTLIIILLVSQISYSE